MEQINSCGGGVRGWIQRGIIRVIEAFCMLLRWWTHDYAFVKDHAEWILLCEKSIKLSEENASSATCVWWCQGIPDGMQSVTNDSVLQMYEVTLVKGVGNKIKWSKKIK